MPQQNITIQTKSSDTSQNIWNDGMVKTTASQVTEEANRKFVTTTEKNKIQSIPINIDGVPLMGQSSLNHLYMTGDPSESISKTITCINNGTNNLPLIENGTSIYIFLVNGHKCSSMILKFNDGVPYPVKYFGNTNSSVLEQIKTNTVMEFQFYDNAWHIIGALDYMPFIDVKLTANVPIQPNTATKIKYDSKGLITGGELLGANDIPPIAIDKVIGLSQIITELMDHTEIDAIKSQLDSKISANNSITAGTATKVTYDTKGLVTGGTNLIESDIPTMPINKIQDLQTSLDSKLNKNTSIIPNIATKVSYDANGLIINGSTLTSSDIPQLDITKITNLQSILNTKMQSNAAITAGISSKISYDSKGLITGGEPLLSSDIPDIPITKVIGLNDALINIGSSAAISDIQAQLLTKIDKNPIIPAGISTKITYDAKGLITGGSNLIEADIPQLNIAKINNLQTSLDAKLNKNIDIVASTATKVTYDKNGLITNKMALEATDIPTIAINQVATLQEILSHKVLDTDLTQLSTSINESISKRVLANNPIIAGTATKVTYDAKGLVTAGSNLTEADVPSLSISKITTLQTALDSKATTSHAAETTTYGISSVTKYGHAMAGNTIMALGTASVGTDNGKYARADHVHPLPEISGDANTVNGFHLDQDVTTAGNPTFNSIKSNGNVEIPQAGDFITTNGFGYKGKLTDGSIGYLLYIDNLDRINLGHQNRPIVLNATNVKLSNSKQLATLDDLPVIPTTLPANGGNADTVDGFHLDQDVTTVGNPTFNNMQTNSVKSKDDIEIINNTGSFIIPNGSAYMGRRLDSSIANLLSIDDQGAIYLGSSDTPICINNTNVKLRNGQQVATVDQIPASLPANGGNSNTVNGFTVGCNVPADAKFTDTIYTHPDSHPISMITNLQTTIDSKLSKNVPIVANSATKITYDANGLITNGEQLTAADIPSLDISKITNLQTALDNKALISQIPTTLPANGGNADTVGGFTVGKSVPTDAKFTDTIYTHPADHPYSMITGAPASLPASDVYTWAKAASKPTYTVTEVNGAVSMIMSATAPSGTLAANVLYCVYV